MGDRWAASIISYEESPLKSEQNLSVLAFYDMDPIIQANMFVDINNKNEESPGVIIELNAKLKWGSKKPKEFIQALNATSMLDLALKMVISVRFSQIEGDRDTKTIFWQDNRRSIRTQNSLEQKKMEPCNMDHFGLYLQIKNYQKQNLKIN